MDTDDKRIRILINKIDKLLKELENNKTERRRALDVQIEISKSKNNKYTTKPAKV